MPRMTLLLTACLLLGNLASPPLRAWGALGHRRSAATALQDLPAELAPWFAGLESTVTDHVNDPDRWKSHDPQEGPRHFLDCENYGGPAQVPQDQAAARARLGDELFQSSGQVPWSVLDRVRRLTEAFRAGDRDQVAFQAAILCHYVGDLNVPLHTTSNYNGKDSGQPGVHQRWETGLLENLEQDGEVQDVRAAELGADPGAAPWAWLRQSYDQVAGLLADDRTALDQDGRDLDRQGPAYWRVFRSLQGPVLREQLALSGQRTAQMILWAWSEAGRPAPPQ